jgi:hypothetical protein
MGGKDLTPQPMLPVFIAPAPGCTLVFGRSDASIVGWASVARPGLAHRRGDHL